MYFSVIRFAENLSKTTKIALGKYDQGCHMMRQFTDLAAKFAFFSIIALIFPETS